MHRRAVLLSSAILVAVTMGACTQPDGGATPGGSTSPVISTPSTSAPPTGEGPGGRPSGSASEGGQISSSPRVQTLEVVVNESFSLPDELLSTFEEAHNARVELVMPPEQSSLVDFLLQHEQDPPADVVYGLDNTVVTQLADGGIIDAYESPSLPADSSQFALEGLTPIDFGDVCINADTQWFEDNDIPLPTTLEELTEPQYAGLLVLTDPTASPTGRSFLLATIETFGDEWSTFWAELDDNGMELVTSWEAAYRDEFTAVNETGRHPLTIAYASSPAYTLVEDGEGETSSRSVALLGTCLRQIEFAAVLEGADDPGLAEAFVDFLLTEEVQAAIPENMYMYPVLTSVELPESWQQFAPPPQSPLYVGLEELDENLEDWLLTWEDLDLTDG